MLFRLKKSLEDYCTIEDKSDLITKLRVFQIRRRKISYLEKLPS
ncbi:MAG: hypothetical protein Ct9H300mP5_4480 [Candidatus Pelagibacterales bacterium]|nr:MAG: hypothetical protein Ct9H300mP5_4480 [Pelagibacterales bacterium]